MDKQRFDLYIEDITAKEDETIVKVETAAICKADLRYYLGLRDEKILGLKYPIALIHEAVGSVVKDRTGQFQMGDKVALCPNLVTSEDIKKYNELCANAEFGENYIPNAFFASSNVDGFSKNYLSIPAHNLVRVPVKHSNSILVFTELISVAINAIRRIQIKPKATIGIWGDGILGYILSVVLSFVHDGQIVVIGAHQDKLEKFDAADLTYHYADHFKDMPPIDIAFECIGGNRAEAGINQMIDVVNAGAKIVLTGVTEGNVGINTRRILERGLSLFGATRSNIRDFEEAAKLLEDNRFAKCIEQLILSKEYIHNIVDYYNVFEKESQNKKLGKHILYFSF